MASVSSGSNGSNCAFPKPGEAYRSHVFFADVLWVDRVRLVLLVYHVRLVLLVDRVRQVLWIGRFDRLS
jgi:hypothetical protein